MVLINYNNVVRARQRDSADTTNKSVRSGKVRLALVIQL